MECQALLQEVHQESTRSPSGVLMDSWWTLVRLCVKSTWTDLVVRDLSLKSPKQNALTRVETWHHYMIS
jgi:hypothetical protein